MNEQLVLNFRKGSIQARSLDELIGLCRGIIADNSVNFAEANFLMNWLEANQAIAKEFPANVLYPRIIFMLGDGVLDAEESKELLVLLKAMTGEEGQQGTIGMSTGLAFDSPLPNISFNGQKFCLTGKFAYGERSDVEVRCLSLGATCVKSVSKRGCVLVVGCMGSEAWIHSTHGRKIQAAVEARDAGAPILIISEEHWHNCAERDELHLDREKTQGAWIRTEAQHAIRDILRNS